MHYKTELVNRLSTLTRYYPKYFITVPTKLWNEVTMKSRRFTSNIVYSKKQLEIRGT